MPLTCIQPADQAITDGVVSEEFFMTHLRRHAHRLFPELRTAEMTIRLVNDAARAHSQVFEFELTDMSRVHNVICKVALPAGRVTNTAVPVQQRPRLFSPINAVNDLLREYRAMESVERHFSALNDPRFGTITMLDLIKSPLVMVMDKCPDADLKSVLKRSTRFHPQRGSTLLQQAFANTGAWLREFHRLPPLQHAIDRHETRQHFVDAVERFTDGLIQKTGRRSEFAEIRNQLSGAANRILPHELPRAVLHGDFAPRNILVRSDARITVFDTQRLWRAPLYEDLAYLLISVKAASPQVRCQGALFSRRQLATWEARFLNAYFDETPPPLAAVRLYECLLLLEWWAAVNFRHSNGTLAQRAARTLSNRYLSCYIQSLLADISAFESKSPASR